MTFKVGGAGKRRDAKYAAVPTVVNGFRFASKAEARRYSELLLLGMAGEIRNLELQPRFPLKSNGDVIASYIADFRYQLNTGFDADCNCVDTYKGRCDTCCGVSMRWLDVVEDVKGMKTPMYRLKKKLAESQYGIQIRETR